MELLYPSDDKLLRVLLNGTSSNETPADFGSATQSTDFDQSLKKIHCARMVVIEMLLALLGIIFNLIVIISVREREQLLNTMINVILTNICFANLIAAVFVKSIAIIYNGYAVATSVWEVELAFCTIHTISFRMTWAVFPYSIVVLCWYRLACRTETFMAALKRHQHHNQPHSMGEREVAIAMAITAGSGAAAPASEQHQLEHQNSLEGPDNPSGQHVSRGESNEEGKVSSPEGERSESDEEEYEEGLVGKQKTALGFIWSVAACYAVLSQEILSKERYVPCSVRHKLSDHMNLLSLVVVICVPILVGPVLCSLLHLMLSCFQMCCSPKLEHELSHDHHGHKEQQSGDERSHFLEVFITFLFLVVFLFTYPTHMYITEVYLATDEERNKEFMHDKYKRTHFLFMLFKYCLGCSHLILLPLLVIIIKGDIRRAAVDVFLKRTDDSQQQQQGGPAGLVPPGLAPAGGPGDVEEQAQDADGAGSGLKSLEQCLHDQSALLAMVPAGENMA